MAIRILFSQECVCKLRIRAELFGAIEEILDAMWERDKEKSHSWQLKRGTLGKESRQM